MAKHELTCEMSVTPTATKFLKSQPIVISVKYEVETDGSDEVLFAKIEKAWVKEFTANVNGQLGHLNRWLTEKQVLIDDMMAKMEAMKKLGVPGDPATATKVAKNLTEAQALGEKITQFPADYAQIVSDWAENVGPQQARVALVVAQKKVRTQAFDDKSSRVRWGKAIRGILIVVGIALAIATIVLTCGAAAPVAVALGAIGIGLSGVSGLAKIGKSIKDTYDMGQRIQDNVDSDMDRLRNMLGKVGEVKDKMPKHVTELQNVMKVRLYNVSELQKEIGLKKVELKNYEDEIKLFNKTTDTMDVFVTDDIKTEIMLTKGSIARAEAQIAKIHAANTKAEELLEELKALTGGLEKIPYNLTTTVKQSLKNTFGSADGILEAVDAVAGVTSGIAGVIPGK